MFIKLVTIKFFPMKSISLSRVVLFILVTTFIGNIGAQTSKLALTGKEKQLFDEAKKYAKQGDLKKSNDRFEKLISSKTDFAEAYLRLASNNYTLKLFGKSEELFSKAIALDADFDPEMYFSLAMVQVELKKYRLAADNLEIFINKEKLKMEKVKKAIKMRDNLRFTVFAISHPVPFKPENMGPNINSENSEYSAILSLDGNKMIFTRNVKKKSEFIGQEDFFMSELDSLGWGKAYSVADLNTSQNEGAFSISANGKYIVFTACDRKDAFGSCDLYYSMLLNGAWTMPVNMGNRVNSAAWDSQPTLSADGRSLIFASRRLGTLGGSDLFMTYRDAKNAWVTPVNLGNIVNTEGDDESPFLHTDGATLYFRSNGRPGMGKHDIYFSRKNDTTEMWQIPVNIGYPINTDGDEGSLTVSIDGKTAYYTSDINLSSGLKNNNLDIFSFQLYEAARPKSSTIIKGYVTDAISGKPVKADIRIKELGTGNNVFQLQTDDDGYFISGISVGKNYACIAEHKDYTYHAENFNLSEVKELFNSYSLDIKLMPILKSDTILENKPVILQNIFFATGSFELLPTSYHEIELLAKMMLENKSISIKLTGHTDDVGSEQDNLLLSQLRAKSVATAIVEKGVDKSRVISDGKGEILPLADNTTEEGRKKNRRTEMLVIQ